MQPKGSTSLFFRFKRECERKKERRPFAYQCWSSVCLLTTQSYLILFRFCFKFFKSVPMRNKRSICPIFSDSELVVVIADIVNASATVVLTTTKSPLLLANSGGPLVVVSLALLGWGWIACLFGFGMHGEPDVLNICCTAQVMIICICDKYIVLYLDIKSTLKKLISNIDSRTVPVIASQMSWVQSRFCLSLPKVFDVSVCLSVKSFVFEAEIEQGPLSGHIKLINDSTWFDHKVRLLIRHEFEWKIYFKTPRRVLFLLPWCGLIMRYFIRRRPIHIKCWQILVILTSIVS